VLLLALFGLVRARNDGRWRNGKKAIAIIEFEDIEQIDAARRVTTDALTHGRRHGRGDDESSGQRGSGNGDEGRMSGRVLIGKATSEGGIRVLIGIEALTAGNDGTAGEDTATTLVTTHGTERVIGERYASAFDAHLTMSAHEHRARMGKHLLACDAHRRRTTAVATDDGVGAAQRRHGSGSGHGRRSGRWDHSRHSSGCSGRNGTDQR
jgi:hypothetical protein